MPKINRALLNNTPQPCPDFFRKNSYDYEKLAHENGWYCYTQSYDGRLIALEAFKEKEQKEQTVTIGGSEIHYPHSHRLPSNESFGVWAFTIGFGEPMDTATDEDLLNIFRNFIQRKNAQD